MEQLLTESTRLSHPARDAVDFERRDAGRGIVARHAVGLP